PVARINYSPWVFVAKPDAPFGTIKGMADWAKANPDKLIYSSDNVNGPTHIVFLLIGQKTGAKMRPLQLGGGGPALTSLLDSHTQPGRPEPHGLLRGSGRGSRTHPGGGAPGPLVDPPRTGEQPCRLSRPAVRPASISCSTSGVACWFPKARPPIVLRSLARA